MDGKAVERILKVIQDLSPAKKLNGPVSLPQRLDYRRWILKFVGRKGLNFTRKIRKILSGNTDPGYFLQKFPGLSISEIELKLERFRKIKPSVSVEDIHIERVKYFPKIYHLTTD